MPMGLFFRNSGTISGTIFRLFGKPLVYDGFVLLDQPPEPFILLAVVLNGALYGLEGLAFPLIEPFPADRGIGKENPGQIGFRAEVANAVADFR